MDLHEAMAVVLGDGTMTYEQIADEVNSRGLYLREDREDIPPWQVRLRARNYPHCVWQVKSLGFGKEVCHTPKPLGFSPEPRSAAPSPTPA